MRQRQIWPAFENVQAQLECWAQEHPDLVKLEIPGRTAQGRPIYAARLSDAKADDDNKEHVLITSQHAGRERTGTTGILYLMRWLLSEDPLAQEILRRQVVVCMPVVNPDGYVLGNSYNTEGLNPCDHWTLDGPVDPDKCPEAAAVQRMLDEYQPEVHSDYHGLDMSFPGYIMQENSGGSYGNVSLRPYHYRITQLMDEAALEEGYPSDLQEQDAER